MTYNVFGETLSLTQSISQSTRVTTKIQSSVFLQIVMNHIGLYVICLWQV